MATQTLRPATLADSAGGWAANGGAPSIQAALSDNSDVTSARLPSGSIPNSFFRVGLTALSALPALAQIRTVTVRVRVAESAPATDSFFCQVWTTGTNGQVGGGPGGGVAQSNLPAMPLPATTEVAGVFPYNPSGAVWQAADLAGTSVLIAYTSPASSPGATSAQIADVFELYVDVAYNQAPTFTITSASTFATSRPTFTGTYSDPEGDAQERIWAKVFTAAQVAAGGFNPDTTTPFLDLGERFSSTPSAAVTTDLPDGSYWAYIKVADVSGSGPFSPWAGRYSAYATQAFVIATAGPAAPTITAAADAANARNIITVQGTTNVLTQNQADVETDTTGFVALTNTTITRSTTQAANNLASLRLSSTAAGTMTAGTLTGLSGVPVRGGTTWTGFAKIRAGASARTCRLGVAFYDAGGTVIGSTTFSAPASDSTSAWTTYTVTTVTPSNAAFAALVFEVQSTGGAAELHYVDQIGLWPGSSVTWTRGGLSAGTNVIVESSDDGGVTWTAIRGSPFPLAGPYTAWVNAGNTDAVFQTWSLYDYEMLTTVGRIYRARATVVNELAATVTSATSASTAPLTFTPVNWIVKDPLNPANNLLVAILRYEGETLTERMGIFYALGRSLPIVVSNKPGGWDGKITLTALGPSDVVAIERLWKLQSPLYVQGARGESRYIRLHDQRGRKRRAGYSRDYTSPFVEVTPP